MLLRRPAGNHLCATNSANVSTMLAIAKRNTVNVPSSGASHGVYRSAMREHQRSQHNEDAKGQRAERGDQHVSDRLEPQQNPVSRLQFAIGAVEADAQAL